MELTPTLDEVERCAADGRYDVLPVSCEIPAGRLAPLDVISALKRASSHCFLLESAEHGVNGQYSFIGYDPSLSLHCVDGVMTVDDATFPTNNPSEHIREILTARRSPRIAGMPSFTGGLVGYFSYDYISYAEPTVPRAAGDGDVFRDVDLMLFDQVIAFDHERQTIILISNMTLHGGEAAYADACSKLEGIAEFLRTIEGTSSNDNRNNSETGRLTGPMTPLFNETRFCAMVERAKRHIKEGDIFQIVLSNRLSAPFTGNLLGTYRALRDINPSPYMFYFSGDDVEIAGASPETLGKLENGELRTFPLAGTRPRGHSDTEDRALEQELLGDPKELAEHNMLVDLGRNDLGKVCDYGSVEVERLRDIERFSHVMHIGSTVRGRLREDRDALDAIEAVLPAGTLSGAPKIRACQLIAELEQAPRGIYGGAIGYIDLTGNMDTCIAIRLAYAKNGTVYVRSGAGIVADSIAENEYRECINKAAAVTAALRTNETALPVVETASHAAEDKEAA